MKKLIRLFITVFAFLLFQNVNAAENLLEVSAHDIPSDTYIIGTHVFTEERLYLSTQDIMWASKTIEGNSKDDMIIYYKDLNGTWINGLTGEKTTVPSTFKIEEVNSEPAQLFTIESVLILDDYEVIDVLNEYEYNELYFEIDRNQVNLGINEYGILLNAYGIEDDIYKLGYIDDESEERGIICYDMFDSSDTPIAFESEYIELYDGYIPIYPFYVDMSIFDDKNEMYTCYVSLYDQDDEFVHAGVFYFTVGEGTPELIAGALEVEVVDEEVSYIPELTDIWNYHNPLDYNYFEILNNSNYTGTINLEVLAKDIQTGDYELTVEVYKDNELVELQNQFENTYIVEDYWFDLSIDFGDTIEPGYYEVYIHLDGYEDYDEIIEIQISPESKITPVDLEITQSANSEYFHDFIETNLINHAAIHITPLDRKNPTKMTITYETDLEDGIYLVSSSVYEVEDWLPEKFNVKTFVQIEVVDGAFEFDIDLSVNSHYVTYFVTLDIYEGADDDSIGTLVGKTNVAIKNGTFPYSIEWGEDMDSAGQSYLYIVDQEGEHYSGYVNVYYDGYTYGEEVYVPYDGVLLIKDLIEEIELIEVYDY